MCVPLLGVIELGKLFEQLSLLFRKPLRNADYYFNDLIAPAATV